ncbi:MAG: nucleotidyltransferase/DNA polymerase involved in DNA repair [Cellvibrionaceae bacterium]|jgi:nucleotidyltransferase/DNA polymerase involved in DNA repair
MILWLILSGAIVLIVLSFIAWRLQKRVKQIESVKVEQRQELEELKDNHQQYLNSSIQILAKGILDEQLTLTEGAIRISVLLGNLKINDNHREEYSAFFQLAEATSHIPILDAWKKLPKKEKARLEKERVTIEEKYKDFIVDAAKRIKGQRFSSPD